MAKRRKNDPPKMVFEKARETPKAKPNKAPDGSTNSIKKVIPTKDGIYRPAKAPAKPVSTAKKTTPKKLKKSSPRNVQHSSSKRAERQMKKNVKRRQKGKPIKNNFNRR